MNTKDKREFNLSALSGEELRAYVYADDGGALQLQTDDAELSMTRVFIEVFFNQRRMVDVADQMGISQNAVMSNYRNAGKKSCEIIKILDRKGHGSVLKKSGRLAKFTDIEQAFLLTHIFGFTTAEASEITGIDPGRLRMALTRQAKKYKEAFTNV
ncbi:MAG: hypothetical protein HQK65_05620 [Desulfamplus sp.]|nr:hypothetical protein [Desulfamplus sp.]